MPYFTLTLANYKTLPILGQLGGTWSSFRAPSLRMHPQGMINSLVLTDSVAYIREAREERQGGRAFRDKFSRLRFKV